MVVVYILEHGACSPSTVLHVSYLGRCKASSQDRGVGDEATVTRKRESPYLIFFTLSLMLYSTIFNFQFYELVNYDLR